MSSLYISQHEMAAIKALDTREVEKRVDQALSEGSPAPLYGLQLSSSGSHISSHLRRYERDLATYVKAKAASKRSETRSRAWSSGHDLVYAVRDMKRRVEEQEKEVQLLQIDDQIMPPYSFRDRVEVRINYQWRATADAVWTFGAIHFFHEVDMRPDYTRPQPTRKLSAAKLEDERQESLFRHWDRLRTLGLHAVHTFLKSGGDGSAIPREFEAKPDRTDRYLNNLSCNFWGTTDVFSKVGRADPIGDMPERPSDGQSTDGRLKLQQRVKHAKFGEGIVTHIDADKVTADFGERGSKRVLASFLEPLEPC